MRQPFDWTGVRALHAHIRQLNERDAKMATTNAQRVKAYQSRQKAKLSAMREALERIVDLDEGDMTSKDQYDDGLIDGCRMAAGIARKALGDVK